MARKCGKRFETILKHLRRECPTPRPTRVVSVTQRTLDRAWPQFDAGIVMGDCTLHTDQRNTIRVSSALTQDSAIETLLHEWSHSLAPQERQPHGSKWGAAYSRVYRVWEKL